MILEDLFKEPSAMARFRTTPLGPEMDDFCEWLHRQGFRRNVMRRRIWQVSHFNQYLQKVGIKDCREVERSHGERFILKHLPRCRCGGRGIFKHVDEPRSVRSFLNYLSERGLLEVVAEVPPPYQALFEEYLDYLKRERNLAKQTLKIHRANLMPFLEHLGADAIPSRLYKLSAEQVQSFFLTSVEKKKVQTISKSLQSVLRTFFRFCQQQGYIHHDLSQAIPSIRTYKLASTPRGISDQDIHRILDHIDRKSPVGLRDFAIIQLLRAYGVRGGQVCALRLKDIQWSQNSIRFPALKGGKEVVEPLIPEIGESLLDYLRFGRPHAAWSEVFLTAQAPIRPIRNPSTMTAIVARHMRRAGVVELARGSRCFRHAFATRMLQHGQPLKVIADMLGHRDINTTFIYTKVDLKTLSSLPLDWPEV